MKTQYHVPSERQMALIGHVPQKRGNWLTRRRMTYAEVYRFVRSPGYQRTPTGWFRLTADLWYATPRFLKLIDLAVIAGAGWWAHSHPSWAAVVLAMVVPPTANAEAARRGRHTRSAVRWRKLLIAGAYLMLTAALLAGVALATAQHGQ